MKRGASIVAAVVTSLAVLVPAGPTSAATAVPPAFVSSWGSQGTGDGQFEQPFMLAADRSGGLWVSDTANNRIVRFDASGTYLGSFGDLGDFSYHFDHPLGVATDSAGNVYIADSGNDRIEKYTNKAIYVASFGSEGTADGQFNEPTGIAIDSKDHIWVSDHGNDRIQEFTTTGTHLRTIGGPGEGDGQFLGPAGLAVDRSDHLYVADTLNDRIEKFDSSGTYLTTWGSSTTFDTPYGVAADMRGDIWVTDFHNNRVRSFTGSGVASVVLGATGTGNGKFTAPRGVAFGPDGSLYVTDEGNYRIQRFAYPYWPFTSWDSLVSQQLLDFTGSRGTTTSRAPWVQKLAAGTTSVPTFITDRLDGSWFAPHMAPVARLYWAYFGRIPDYAGLTYWTGKHRTGTTISKISQGFATSSEFLRKYGSLSNRQFVTRIYSDVLGRTPDTAGVNFWTARLDKGTSRGQVMINFSESSEYKNKMLHKVNVVMAYAGMLHRKPSTAEVKEYEIYPIGTCIEAIRLGSGYFDRVN